MGSMIFWKLLVVSHSIEFALIIWYEQSKILIEQISKHSLQLNINQNAVFTIQKYIHANLIVYGLSY